MKIRKPIQKCLFAVLFSFQFSSDTIFLLLSTPPPPPTQHKQKQKTIHAFYVQLMYYILFILFSSFSDLQIIAALFKRFSFIHDFDFKFCN